jgi:hypothetical protein
MKKQTFVVLAFEELGEATAGRGTLPFFALPAALSVISNLIHTRQPSCMGPARSYFWYFCRQFFRYIFLRWD